MVIADTAARINRTGIPAVQKLRRIKPHGKFLIIVDECDAMYRTEERGQQMEQAYDKLMAMGPALRIEISATPIPTLLYLYYCEGHQVEVHELGTSEDYSGVAEMQSLKDKDGDSIFLDIYDLKYNEGVSYNDIKQSCLAKTVPPLLFGSNCRKTEVLSREFSIPSKLTTIPCTDDNVMKLYNDALSISEEGLGKKGILLLDCTINRVYTENNVFQKAGTCVCVCVCV